VAGSLRLSRHGPHEAVATTVDVQHELALAALVPERAAQANHRDREHVFRNLAAPHLLEQGLLGDEFASLTDQDAQQAHDEGVCLDGAPATPQLQSL
jgi:hypothetical protein